MMSGVLLTLETYNAPNETSRARESIRLLALNVCPSADMKSLGPTAFWISCAPPRGHCIKTIKLHNSSISLWDMLARCGRSWS